MQGGCGRLIHMHNLNIGTVKIPINATTKTFAILAKRGAGKTYTAGVLAEEFAHSNIPFVVFDPIDVWWGLRLDKKGKGKGLPVVRGVSQHIWALLLEINWYFVKGRNII